MEEPCASLKMVAGAAAHVDAVRLLVGGPLLDCCSVKVVVALLHHLEVEVQILGAVGHVVNTNDEDVGMDDNCSRADESFLGDVIGLNVVDIVGDVDSEAAADDDCGDSFDHNDEVEERTDELEERTDEVEELPSCCHLSCEEEDAKKILGEAGLHNLDGGHIEDDWGVVHHVHDVLDEEEGVVKGIHILHSIQFVRIRFVPRVWYDSQKYPVETVKYNNP